MLLKGIDQHVLTKQLQELCADVVQKSIYYDFELGKYWLENVL